MNLPYTITIYATAQFYIDLLPLFVIDALGFRRYMLQPWRRVDRPAQHSISVDSVSMLSKPRRLPINQHVKLFQQHRHETDAQTIRVYLHYFDHYVLVTAKTLTTLGVATHLHKYHQSRSMQHLSIYPYSSESTHATQILVISRTPAFGEHAIVWNTRAQVVTRIHFLTLEPPLWNENASARLYR